MGVLEKNVMGSDIIPNEPRLSLRLKFRPNFAKSLTQDDKGVHDIVLDSVPPGPEALGPLRMALDLLTQLSSNGCHCELDSLLPIT